MGEPSPSPAERKTRDQAHRPASRGLDPALDVQPERHINILYWAFRNSVRGLSAAARSERAVRQELIVMVAAAPAAILISDRLWTRVALVGVLMLLVTIELLNTAIEKLCDHVTPTQDPAIGLVKDVASAAVLCALVLALLVWGAALAEFLVLKFG